MKCDRCGREDVGFTVSSQDIRQKEPLICDWCKKMIDLQRTIDLRESAIQERVLKGIQGFGKLFSTILNQECEMAMAQSSSRGDRDQDIIAKTYALADVKLGDLLKRAEAGDEKIWKAIIKGEVDEPRTD